MLRRIPASYTTRWDTIPGTSIASRTELEAAGATVAEADDTDAEALKRACASASCVLSALGGLESLMIGMQGALPDATVAAGVQRFVPSDSSLDLTKTRPGDNHNLDARRAFMARLDRT